MRDYYFWNLIELDDVYDTHTESNASKLLLNKKGPMKILFISP